MSLVGWHTTVSWDEPASVDGPVDRTRLGFVSVTATAVLKANRAQTSQVAFFMYALPCIRADGGGQKGLHQQMAIQGYAFEVRR